MAQRRMFSLRVIDADIFLDMPTTTRLLYFDLCMRADDDGFVSSPRKIIRMTGASEDDLKILLTKEFVIAFESGVCVVKHWKLHNQIKKDRYQQTLHTVEKSQLETNENGVYTFWNQNGTKMDPKWNQNGSKVEPQVRLVKGSLVKERVVEGSSQPTTTTTTNFTPSFQNVIQTYQNNIGLITSHISERIEHLLNDGITEPLLCKYIEVATERNKRNWAYVEKMAIGNLAENVRTVEEYEARRTEFKAKFAQQQQAKPSHANFDQRGYAEDELEHFFDNLKED